MMRTRRRFLHASVEPVAWLASPPGQAYESDARRQTCYFAQIPRDGGEWTAQTLMPLHLIGRTEQWSEAAVFVVKHPTEIIDVAELEKERQQPSPAVDEIDLARPTSVEISRIMHDHPDRV